MLFRYFAYVADGVFVVCLFLWRISFLGSDSVGIMFGGTRFL